MNVGMNIAENSQVALENAYKLAQKLNKSSVSVEYILYGLASVENCVASRILKK